MFAVRSRAWYCSGVSPGSPGQLDLEELRAGLQTATATHALAVEVGHLLGFLRLPRSRPEVVVAIDRQPGQHLLQDGENPRAIDQKVAEDGKLRHRPELDFARPLAQQLGDQRGARLPHAAVDQHGACPANFFQAIALPDHGRSRLAVHGGRVRGNPLQHADAVHVGLESQLEPLPIAFLAGARPAAECGTRNFVPGWISSVGIALVMAAARCCRS